ncbi:ImmA/IrrE family metallo-endopeptidase [Bacillus sp. 1P06AnD]|uniref:ImmA/IrrE family metallo-endopeptidase n=1 Tax=Bacillus sp. 1P06AnD TaxID=3132208 RepID=UPI0039A001DF
MIRKKWIDEIVTTLVKRHDSRNPYTIAEEKNILFLNENLGNIYGYYNKVNRIQFIHINQNMPPQRQFFTCCHELGHCFLHPDENTPMLSEESLRSEVIIEAEANYFAAKLILDGSHLEENINDIYTLLNFYGLPLEVERIAMQILNETN